ncbi:hypothetical protein Q73_13980 [Bacillus coahuilensis m2-6]|nr:hypothetical protein Q73_13980 [Bacillus coahuilensis m2-6]
MHATGRKAHEKAHSRTEKEQTHAKKDQLTKAMPPNPPKAPTRQKSHPILQPPRTLRTKGIGEKPNST